MKRHCCAVSIFSVLAIGVCAADANALANVPEAAVAQPPIVTAKQWGSKPMPIPESRKQVPQWITIHNAGELWKKGEDPVEFVRHMQIWGQHRPELEKPPRDTFWPDLPYHFLIAPDGRIFEGRPVQYEPESNTKYPLKGNIGVEMMGDFNLQRPSAQQLRACVQLTAWLCRKYHIDLNHVRTHQDVAPGQTDCPGKDFYRYMQGRGNSPSLFKQWVREALNGRTPNVVPGPPLEGGPTKTVGET